jgi:hypothetical protein
MTQKLIKIISLMIPANTLLGLPSGAEIEELIMRISKGELSHLEVNAEKIASLLYEETGIHLEDSSAMQFEKFVESHRQDIKSHLRMIGNELLRSYYTDPRVLDAVGGSSRAPFPLGFPMEGNNLDLLKEVFDRGPIYREILDDL